MPHIHYKFSSRLSYDTVVFDGVHITLNELKRQIMGRQKLRAGDCDLQITNAQTKEEYTDSGSVIPKGSSVIVRRIPSSSGKTHNNERSEVQLHHAFGASRAMDDHSSTKAFSFFSKIQMANLVDVDASEEDKIKVMIKQSTYDSMNVNTKPTNALSANYTCYRCGNPGHHIRNCPSSGQDKNSEVPVKIKKSTGIPRSFMVEVDDPNIKGAKLTNCGRYAIPAIDAEAYAIGKKEKPPFLAQEPESEDQDDPIPSELLCLICNELLADAVVIPCCGNSYCDECIRTALLDSECHICPTCDRSEVSPDTLIANKFLRQAVNNFKKEQGHDKSLKRKPVTSQSQNLTPAPTPVPTPPPLLMQSQPQKPQQSFHSQQDSLLDHPKTANTPPQSQVSEVLPATADPPSENNTAGTSLQPLQNQLEISEHEIEGKACSDSVGAALSGKVSSEDPTDAPSQRITLDDHTLVTEQPQTVSVSQENPHSCSGPTPESSVSLESSSSSLVCLSGGKTESNTQQLSTIPYTSSPCSYSNTPPPFFPSPRFHTYLSAQQSHTTYPPGYPPATPIWTLPAPQGTPIPSLCSSTTTPPSIPRLIPQEWYKYQRKKKERSPQGTSGYRRSSSHSKPSAANASCTYSCSSSHSESRSRSRSKSRHRSPYSHQRDLHTRSRQPSSYTYGYKRSRSPTPSSSSSPRRARHSRSKSLSGKKDRHRSKKSSSSSNHSRKRKERSEREAARSEDSVSRNICKSEADSLDLDREFYLQWKEEYKEWYEKYFSTYQQFHQLPVPLLSLPPPPPPPQWVSTERSSNQSQASMNSRYQPQDRCPAEMDGCSPSSESSSDSRSSPSHSSSESRTMPSQSCSDSSSPLSYKANDSRSPPSQSSSDGRSTPSEDRAQLRACPERPNEKSRHKQDMLTKGSTEMKLQGPSTDNKPLKKLEDLSPLKNEQKKKKQPEDHAQETLLPHAENSRDDSRKDKRKHKSEPKACKHSTPVHYKDSKQDQPERKFIESNSKGEQCWKRGKDLDSKDGKRPQKAKSSKELDGTSKEREEKPGGRKTPESRSEKNKKRKDDDLVKNERGGSLSAEMQSGKHLKTKTAEEPENYLGEFLKLRDKEKQKTEKKSEKKTWPLTAKDIWEEGIKVKPQMKISININLDGKRKEENTGKHEVTGNVQENISYPESREEEQKVNRWEVNEKESSRNREDWSEDKLKQGEGETSLTWDKFTFRDDKGVIAGEVENTRERKDENEGELDLWHCALIGREESETGKAEQERRRREFDDNKDQDMGESQKKQENREAWTEGLMEGIKMPMREEDKMRFSLPRSKNAGHQDGTNTKLDDGSSTSGVGSREEESRQSTVVKTMEKYTQKRWKELIYIQVPRSTLETEDEQGEGKARVHTDRVSVTLPQLSVTTKAEGDEEQRRERRREKERDSACSWSHRSVAPSSVKDRAESTTSADPGRETRRERERNRNRERERQQERKRSKEQTREEVSRRDGDPEQKRIASLPTSSQFYSSSTSHDAERTERRHGGSQGSNKSSSCPSSRNRESSMISREPDLPDENAQKTQRDLSLNLRYKDKDYSHYHSYHRDSSGNNKNKDRAPGTHHSHSRGKGRELLPFESPGYSQRESPHLGLMQSKAGKEEWKPNKAEKLVKGGEEGKDNRGMMAVQGGGARWEGKAHDKVYGEEDWLGGGRDLEEGEMLSSRSSSVSSSASQGNSKDDKRREEWKQTGKKRQATPERPQHGELKKAKKSKKSREATEKREPTGGDKRENY